MKVYIKILLSAIITCFVIQVNAQLENISNDRFPFDYNKRVKTKKVSNFWNKTFTNLEEQLMNKDNSIILHSYSSATGKKKYNYKLSKDRGKSVKEFLVNRGVSASRISIKVHGEPNIENYGNDDYADDRIVIPVFKRMPPEEYIDPIDEYRNKATLKEDIKDGERIFKKLVEPEVKKVRKEYQMVRKVFLQNPSDDPEELKKQVEGIIEEMKEIKTPKDLAKFGAKIGLDAFVDLFTSLGSKEVEMARQIKYTVITEAITTECFPRYKGNIRGYNFEKKLLFYSIKEKLRHLSNHERYKLRAHFIAGKTFEMYSMSSSWRYEHKMKSISSFKRSLNNWFKKSKNRYRD